MSDLANNNGTVVEISPRTTGILCSLMALQDQPSYTETT